MLKIDARKQLLERRKSLTEVDCLKMDDMLLIQLQKLDWSTTFCLGNFYPMEHQAEPNSLLLAKYLKHIIPGLLVAYPITNKNDFGMDFFVETDSLNVNEWGIHEPMPTQLIVPEQMDTILVPLLGFDMQGQRIGFGKGFYDRYFARCAKNLRRIGISYFEPLPFIQDTHQFDVPLTQCITPWTSYEFQ